MKPKRFVILFLMIFVFLTLAKADIISVNSGGDNGLIINPSEYLEGFFLWANRFPVVSDVVLNSSSLTNTTNENLTVYYTSSDADDHAITNITDWRVDSNSINVLNLAFNKMVNFVTADAVRDYSTNLNHGTLGEGTLENAPLWTSSGKIGGAYLFDGLNDYMQIKGLTGGVNGNITVSMWVNWRGDSGNTDVNGRLTLLNTLNPADEVWINLNTEGNDKFNVYFGDLASPGYHNSNTVILKDGWTHLVARWNGTHVSLYVNGSLDKTVATSGTVTVDTSSFRIGSREASNYNNFNGTIDEVKIYNRSLSNEQIEELYSAGLSGSYLEKIVSQETSKGDVWQVALTPNDAYDDGITVLSNILTIVNANPNDPTDVTLLSVNARNESDSDLNCSGYISDDDNLFLTVDVNWIKDNVSQYNYSFSNQNNASFFTTLLDNNNLTLFDAWKCSIRTYDQSDYSNWVDSNELAIIDITSPNITILSPNETAYTFLDLDFNITVSENENISNCYYSINETNNISMIRFNDTFFYNESNKVIPGTHNATFFCNDTSGNWGSNMTNFTILDEAAISVQLSPAFMYNVNWSLLSLPADDLDATGNNENGSTDYYINLSATGITADLYVKADGDLTNPALDILGLGNETYATNTSNSTVPNPSKVVMTTSYVLVASGLSDGSTVYFKFYLDAPSAQPAGTYTNSLDFKAVSYGNSP